MLNFSCCVKIEFDAAHRVIGHQNKCKYLHGHRYVLEVTASSNMLDQIGVVVDFGFLKGAIKQWIDDNFDHTAILSIEDQPLGEQIANITGQKIYYLPFNPTAENIAFYLKNNIFNIIFQQEKLFTITQILLRETPNCYAVI